MLEGEIPSLKRRPQVAANSTTRCPLVTERCRSEPPAERLIGPQHQSALSFPAGTRRPCLSASAPFTPKPHWSPVSEVAHPSIAGRCCRHYSAATLSAGPDPACSGAAASFAIEGKTLKIRNDGDIRNLDPATRGGWYDETVMFAIFSGLVQFKAGDEWGWQLDGAASIDNTDPLAIPFKLKPGLKWTNGYGEVTSEDVKYSYERFANPKVNAVYASDWAALDTVEITDKYSGVIRLKKPFVPLFTSTLPHASG